MKFCKSVPILLISAVTVVVIVLSLISNRLFSGMTAAVEENQLNLVRSIIQFNLRGAEDRALARAAMVAQLPRARELFAAQDRPGLLAEYQRMFLEQKEKFAVDQAQFHTPPATSFLRLNDPDKFGDDLSTFRPMVVAVNRDQTPRKGFAIARSGPAIFGVVPMFDRQGRHIGSFEMGIAFAGILEGLKNAYNLEMAVFIGESPLREFAKGVSPGILSDQNRVGPFIRFHSTNADLLKELVVDQNLNSLEGTQYVRKVHGNTYGVVLVPLRNSAGDILGFVAAVTDLSASRAAENRSKVWQALMALCAIVLLAGLILVSIRGMLLRPLEAITARFDALSKGDLSDGIETEILCDELKGLAQQHEQLRQQLKKGDK
ncbi:MAG: cache domain-containing protein [Verrucomicrobiae bacterium]|nr:cache domain-containing protein [Verrucomicrobiae bacterium]